MRLILLINDYEYPNNIFRPYCCLKCDKTYYRKYLLAKHIARQHDNLSSTNGTKDSILYKREARVPILNEEIKELLQSDKNLQDNPQDGILQLN